MLCKSCGKNIPANEEKCPFCGHETGFLKGIDGNEDPDGVEKFSGATAGGSFRNSDRMKSLSSSNEELKGEIAGLRKQYKSSFVFACIEGVIIVLLVVLLAFETLLLVKNRNSGNAGTVSSSEIASSAVDSTYSQNNTTSDGSVVSNTSDISSVVSQQTDTSSATSADDETTAYEKAWNAVSGKTLESVTDNGNGGTDTRTTKIVSEGLGRYSVIFSTNGVQAGKLSAAVDPATGVLKGVTEKGVAFSVSSTTDKDGVRIYVVTGTNYYFGKYYVK